MFDVRVQKNYVGPTLNASRLLLLIIRSSICMSYLSYPPLLFVVLRALFLVPFSFVCPFVLSFSVWFLYRLLRFYFSFPASNSSYLSARLPASPWWQTFCSVILSRRYTPPALLASLKYAHSPCVLSSFLSSVADVDLSSFFLLFLPFFDFDLDSVCFHPVFFLWVLCCLLGFGFCCDSFSILVW